MSPEKLLDVIKTTYRDWKADNAAHLAAGLAYYTTFSIVPTLVIVISLAGLLGTGKAVQNEILTEVGNYLGSEGRLFIEGLLETARQPASSNLPPLVGTLTLLFGALGVFGELQNSLNRIWNVQPKPLTGLGAQLKRLLVRRLLSFGMILGIGFVLLVSLILNALFAVVKEYLAALLTLPPFVLQLINFAISFGITTLLFALMFKILPDVENAWKDVWLGAAVTSLLFSMGKVLISEYLGRTSFQTSFGAAGVLVGILVWIYYSAQILFLGAEFTQVYARCCGIGFKPSADALRLTDLEPAKQTRVSAFDPQRKKDFA